jgi:predicted enzyme related to lactoylglutathione lyase
MGKPAASRDLLLQMPDIEAAARFYTELLGCAEFMREPDMIGLEAGGVRLFLDRREPMGPVLEFFVDDVEAAKSAVVAAGGAVLEENASIPRVYVRDRFGLIYNLAKRG